MPFNLNKAEMKRLDGYRELLTKERADLSATVDPLIDVINDAIEKINGAIDTYNEALNSVRGFIDDIHSERQGEFEDKSERWQESERGEAVSEWLTHLEGFADDNLAEIERIEIDTINIDPEDHSEALDNLETEPSS